MTFLLPAIGLSVLAVAFVLWPIYRNRGADAPAARQNVNVSLYEEQLAELSELELSDEERATLTSELQRELLNTTGDEEKPQAVATSPGRLPLVLAILVPLSAWTLYSDFGFSLGAVSDVEIAERIQSSDLSDIDELKAMTRALASSLSREPDNHQGWFLLGQSYLTLRDYPAAQQAFGRLKQRFREDAGIASYFAEAIYLANEREMTPDVEAAIDDALRLNPHDIAMLEIKGMSAFQAGDFRTARDYFSRALAFVQGDRAQLIRQVIARIDRDLAAIDGDVAAEKTVAAEAPAEPAGRALRVTVQLGEDVLVEPGMAVFVYALASNGPPMPLAVQRATVAQLPFNVILDESMAMMPGMGLASFDDVVVVARVSSRGIANADPNDWEARSDVINLPSHEGDVIRLTIEKQIKDIRLPQSS